MAKPARPRATYQDVLDAPPHRIAELIDSALHLSPQPGMAQSLVTGSLAAQLVRSFEHGHGGPGGWVFLRAPEIHLGEQIVVPDLAGWREERMPVIEDVAFGTIAPDWLCETLSEHTEAFDRLDKLPIYAAEGVKHIWLVHPILRTLQVLRLHDGRWLTVAIHHDDQCVRVEPFDAIELDLSLLWRKLAASPPRNDRASEPTATYRLEDASEAYEGY